jgi:hypothetical protein
MLQCYDDSTYLLFYNIQFYLSCTFLRCLLYHLLEVTILVDCYLLYYTPWDCIRCSDSDSEGVRFVKISVLIEPRVSEEIVSFHENECLGQKILQGKVFMEIGKLRQNRSFGICSVPFCSIDNRNRCKKDCQFYSLVIVVLARAP